MAYQPNDWRDTEILVHRAGAIGDSHVPTLAIYAHEEVPDNLSLDEARELYEKEASQIVDAIFQHLPGGVVDRILVGLMEKKASLFRVAL